MLANYTLKSNKTAISTPVRNEIMDVQTNIWLKYWKKLQYQMILHFYSVFFCLRFSDKMPSKKWKQLPRSTENVTFSTSSYNVYPIQMWFWTEHVQYYFEKMSRLWDNYFDCGPHRKNSQWPHNKKTETGVYYLSANSVRCPERHGEHLTIATDVVTVVEDAILGTVEYSRSTVW